MTHKSGSPYGGVVRVLNFNIFHPIIFYPYAKIYPLLGKGILKIYQRFSIGYKFSDLTYLRICTLVENGHFATDFCD